MSENNQAIPLELVRKEAWKLYFVAIAYPLYLFFLPGLFSKNILLSLAYMIFPGVYIATWMACLMHECWHNYVPAISKNFFYNTFSFMLIMDPFIYRLVHGHHHSKVNTYDDIEFHPMGEIQNLWLRRVYNLSEIIFGVIYTFSLQMYFAPRHPTFKSRCNPWEHRLTVAMWVLFYGSVGFLSAITFEVGFRQVAVSFLLSFLIASFVIHQIQMIEHGGLIVEGDNNYRMMQTRNLKNDTIFEKLFLFMTHQDPQEHILHHTMVDHYTRPFVGRLPVPEDAVYISLADHAAILWKMVTKG
ncbi:MAG: fatty acid desaturase [Planctomycetota bacterium]